MSLDDSESVFPDDDSNDSDADLTVVGCRLFDQTKRRQDLASAEIRGRTFEINMQPDGRYHCLYPGCDKKYKNRYVLRDHYCRHGAEPVNQCNECRQKFVHRRSLMRHVRVAHLKSSDAKVKGKFLCYWPGCGKKFKLQRLLTLHQRAAHLGQTKGQNESFRCEYSDCNFETKQMGSLKTHVKTVHLNLRPFKCCDCDYAAGTKGALETHQRVHSDERPFVCEWPGCDFSTKYTPSLRRHRSKHDWPLASEVVTFQTQQAVEQNTSSKEVSQDRNDLVKLQPIPLTKGSDGGEESDANDGRSVDSYGFDNFDDSDREEQVRDDFGKVIHSDKRQKIIEQNDESDSQSAFETSRLFGNELENSVCKVSGFSSLPTSCLDQLTTKAEVRIEKMNVNKRKRKSASRYFYCDWPGCSRRYAKEQTLKMHYRIHNGEDLFACDWPGCRFKTEQRDNLRKHRATHEPSFACEVPGCNYTCARNQQLVIHNRIHTGERPFICKVCSFGATSNKVLQNHMQTHAVDSEKPKELFKCEWPGCDHVAKKKDYLIKHQATHQPHAFVCKVSGCNYSCSRKSSFIIHNRLHTGEFFTCDVCGYKTGNPTWLKRHVKAHDKRVSTSHLKNSDGLYECSWPGCEMKFKNFKRCNNHQNSHSKIRHKCKYSNCSKMYYNKDLLEKHHRAHEEKKKRKRILKSSSVKIGDRFFKCQPSEDGLFHCEWEGCGKKFKQKTVLRIHYAVHGAEKPCVCDWPGCEFRATFNAVLRVHQNVHTGERPFACDWPGCEYRAGNNCYIKQHIKKIHINASSGPRKKKVKPVSVSTPKRQKVTRKRSKKPNQRLELKPNFFFNIDI